MKFELTDDQRFFHETTKKFLDATMPTRVVRELADTADGYEHEWWRQGASIGWTSPMVQERDGGGSLSGNGLADLVIVAEELGRHVAPGPFAPVNLVAALVSLRGTEGQRGEILPGLLDGSTVAGWCGPPGPVAIVRSEGGSVLDGTVEIVEAAARADWLVVSALNGSGVTNVIVPASATGVTVEARNSLDLVRRFGRVVFTDVHIGADAVLGDVGGGAADGAWLERLALVLQTAEMAGAAAQCHELTLEYMSDRYSFGRPIASYQALKHRMADTRMHLESCLALVDDVAAAVGTAGVDTSDLAVAQRLTHATKAYVAQFAPEIIHECVQMHGGIGVTYEHDLHLFQRRATLGAGLLGTTEEHLQRLATLLATPTESNRVRQ